LKKQPARTLNAVSFLDAETISTTYLRWLMEERGFTGFRVSHFLAYEFRDWGADYLLPVLQRRHEEKKPAGPAPPSVSSCGETGATDTTVWSRPITTTSGW